MWSQFLRSLLGLCLVGLPRLCAATPPVRAANISVAAGFPKLRTAPPVRAANISVAAGFPKEELRPGLFGLDLEFTRHDIWSGLSAELISNRNFAVQPAGTTWPEAFPAGFPTRWSPIGTPLVRAISSAVSCPLSAAQSRCGLRQTPVGEGFDSGMGFGSAIAIQSGRSYTFRVVARATGTANGAGLILSVVLAPSLFALNFSIPDSSAWTEQSFEFVATMSARADSLELSVVGEQGILDLNATSLLPNDHFLGMRADVVDALRDLSFKGPLRYPGGCFAPFYDWKAALQPPLVRPAILTPPNYCVAVPGGVNAYSDGALQNGPNIDEYIALCRRIGATPAITLALQYGAQLRVVSSVIRTRCM
jgi:hypothetical protein